MFLKYIIALWATCFDSYRVTSGPQDVDPDIQTFIALWDPQRLQSKMYTLQIYIKHIYTGLLKKK